MTYTLYNKAIKSFVLNQICIFNKKYVPLQSQLSIHAVFLCL